MVLWYRRTRLFGGHDEGIVGLATVRHLNRHAWAGGTEALRGVLHPSVVHIRAAVQREDLGIRQSLRRIDEDGLLVLAVRDDATVEQRHGLALLYALAIDRRIPHGARDLDAVRAVRDLAHRLRVGGGILRWIERDESGHPLRDVPRRPDGDRDARDLRGLLRGEDH